jgi:hypothetical protein
MCQSPYSIADTTAKLIKPEFTGSGADGLHILIGQRAGAAEVTLANEGVDPLFKVSHGLSFGPRRSRNRHQGQQAHPNAIPDRGNPEKRWLLPWKHFKQYPERFRRTSDVSRTFSGPLRSRAAFATRRDKLLPIRKRTPTSQG